MGRTGRLAEFVLPALNSSCTVGTATVQARKPDTLRSPSNWCSRCLCL